LVPRSLWKVELATNWLNAAHNKGKFFSGFHWTTKKRFAHIAAAFKSLNGSQVVFAPTKFGWGNCNRLELFFAFYLVDEIDREALCQSKKSPAMF